MSSKKSAVMLVIFAVIITVTVLIIGYFDSPKFNAYVPSVSISCCSVTSAENSEKININTATAEELTALDSIGIVRAQKIIEYREDNGGFVAVEEITNIDGISSNFLEKNIDKITVG